MEKKRSVGVTVVSIILFLFPLIITVSANLLLFITTGKGLPLTFHEWIKTTCFGFILFSICGLGILKLNNKIRLLTIVYMFAIGISGPLGLIVGHFMIGKEIIAELIKRYGIWVEIFPWVMILPVSLLHLIIAFYLTRPKVKEQFK